MRSWRGETFSVGRRTGMLLVQHILAVTQGEMEALWNHFCVTSTAVSSPLSEVSNTSPALCICKNPLTEAFSSKRCWDLFYQITLQPCLTRHMKKEKTSLKNIPNSSLCHPHMQSWLKDRAACGWGLGRNQPSSPCQAAQGREGFPQGLPSHPSTELRAPWVFSTIKTCPQDSKSKAQSYTPCWKSGTLLKCRNASDQNMAMITKIYNCFS